MNQNRDHRCVRARGYLAVDAQVAHVDRDPGCGGGMVARGAPLMGGPGHNFDPDAERGLDALRDYEIGIAKERAGSEQAKIGREQAIGATVRYGQALIDGRAKRTLSNNAFSDWIDASRLDRTPPFDQRQERAAAQQIAEIALKHVASTVDGKTTVNPFDGCPHSRPTNIMRWWRAKQPKRAPQKPATASATPSPVQAAPAPTSAPTPLCAAPDRVQVAADNAEIETLRKEVWRFKDKLSQLSMYLVEKPQPKAEDRPLVATRAWPLEMRPKDAPPRQIADPPADLIKDPAFALRREEFEQWLVRRREALEHRHAAREAELAKAVEAKVKARVEARFAREDAHGRVFTEAQFMDIWRCLHPDSRKTASDKALARAFGLFQAARKRLGLRRGQGQSQG